MTHPDYLVKQLFRPFLEYNCTSIDMCPDLPKHNQITEPSQYHLVFLINLFFTTLTFQHDFNLFLQLQHCFHDFNFFSRPQLDCLWGDIECGKYQLLLSNCTKQSTNNARIEYKYPEILCGYLDSSLFCIVKNLFKQSAARATLL